MANTYGMHIPNGEIQDLDGLLSLGVSHYTLLHHELRYVPRLRAASPDGVIEMRFYLATWSALDPREWARRCADVYTRDRGGWSLQGLGCRVRPANEMNLLTEGGGDTPEAYRAINRWLAEFARAFRALVPGAVLHWPAVAYGHGEDEYGYALCRESVALYDVVCCHPYWFEPEQVTDRYYGARFELLHAAFPDTPVFCSEAGNFNVTRASTPDEMVAWFENLYRYPYVIGGTPFLWEDPTGAHRSNDWSRNPALIERVRNQSKRPVVQNINGGHTMAEFQVGPGIAAKMREHNDTPATNEWYPMPDVAMAFGTSGAMYVYVKSTNTNHRFPPDS